MTEEYALHITWRVPKPDAGPPVLTPLELERTCRTFLRSFEEYLSQTQGGSSPTVTLRVRRAGSSPSAPGWSAEMTLTSESSPPETPTPPSPDSSGQIFPGPAV